MEKLKTTVPETLQRQIAESTADNLRSACSSLLDFFLLQPEFHQIVRDLTDPETALCGKKKEAALELKRKGNECFSKGECSKALSFYTKALRVAPTSAVDMDKNLVATLYVNRASVLHKMNLLVECVRDCNRALIIYAGYAKAWYRRGKANAYLENYEDALCDLHIAMIVESSLSGKKQIQNELKLLSDQHKGTSRSLERPNENHLGYFQSSVTDEPHQVILQCVSTPSKGRGMETLNDIPQATLIHAEEPYGVIILKPCRETHCHFCLNELPADAVPCLSCSIPLYCSRQCQLQAGGEKTVNSSKNYDIRGTLPDEFEKYVAEITTPNVSASDSQNFAEHRHECHGVHWAAVLPSEIVLAGRILAKSLEQQRHCKYASNLSGILDLSHNYEKLPPERKLELHIYSIILLYCLQHSYESEFPRNGDTISKFVILLSQIMVNSMAIVRMKFGVGGLMDQSEFFSHAGGSLTSNVEQIRVGQAIYSACSLFNHSCLPNIHAYFLSRNVYIRSTEFVSAGCPLELSYGPQVGDLDCRNRQEYLEEKYSFRCWCRGCSQLNLSDLVLNSFRCVKPNCSGVVLGNCEGEYEQQKIDRSGHPPVHGSEAHVQVDKINDAAIHKVVGHLFEQTGCSSNQIEAGCCLNCGSKLDLEAALATASKAGTCIRRLQDAIGANEVQTNILSDALIVLDLLRSTLHPYNKKIAEVEDNIAQAFCLVGELQPAMDHCKASIEILEKLYGPRHIAIGNELVKLSSIQLPLGDPSAVDSLNRVGAIFSRYYGSDVSIIFPHLKGLEREALKLFQ